MSSRNNAIYGCVTYILQTVSKSSFNVFNMAITMIYYAGLTSFEAYSFQY